MRTDVTRDNITKKKKNEVKKTYKDKTKQQMKQKTTKTIPTRYGTLSAADTFLQIFMICLQRLDQSAADANVYQLLQNNKNKPQTENTCLFEIKTK